MELWSRAVNSGVSATTAFVSPVRLIGAGGGAVRCTNDSSVAPGRWCIDLSKERSRIALGATFGPQAWENREEKAVKLRRKASPLSFGLVARHQSPAKSRTRFVVNKSLTLNCILMRK